MVPRNSHRLALPAVGFSLGTSFIQPSSAAVGADVKKGEQADLISLPVVPLSSACLIPGTAFCWHSVQHNWTRVQEQAVSQ